MHVESSARGRYVNTIHSRGMLLLLLATTQGLSINSWNIATAGVAISKARNIGSKGTMRKPCVGLAGFRGMPEAIDTAINIVHSVHVERRVLVILSDDCCFDWFHGCTLLQLRKGSVL